MGINWSRIRYIFGILLLMESFFMIVATCVSGYYCYVYGEDDFKALAIPTGLTILCGILGLVSDRHKNTMVTSREGFLCVSLAWVVFCLLGMLPFLIQGTCTSVTDAFLETMAGFTTTGCTVLTNIDAQPHGILFWRSMTQWIGGLGIVVFSLALLPLIGSGATQIFGAETNGLSMDKLRPRIDQTARRLWTFYLGLTIINTVLYWWFGMSWYDAVCHAFSTMASGGFSTHQESIGYFHSAAIEYTCIIFLFITSVNYNLFYFVSKGRFRLMWRNEELRWFTWIVVFCTVLFMIITMVTRYNVAIPEQDLVLFGEDSLLYNLRTSLFHTLTIISSAGFQAESFDYVAWGPSFWIPTMLLMAMGGCSSSTAGGLKVVRIVVVLKNARNMFLQAVNPRSVSSVRLNDSILTTEVVYKILAMLSVYLILLIITIFLLICWGLSFDTAIGTAVSAFGNTGPAFGTTGPAGTWAEIPDAAKWLLSFVMLVGRLEIFTVMVIFTPMFWRK